MSEAESEARRIKVLEAARWCFLNFGFAKTSFEDVARRAEISRTLLYRIFKDKEDVFAAVFEHWLVARQPEAKRIASGPGSAAQRLHGVCKLMVLEPWSEMNKAPMGGEFYDVCAKLDPEVNEHHRRVGLECFTTVLGDRERATVFLLALDGLYGDAPSNDVLDRRVRVLIDVFTGAKKKA